ncbi:MAG: YegP family protein [Burkholderiales bacterium]
MAGHFELSKSNNGQFNFALKAGNGETILRSEQYVAKPSAQGGIASVQANCASDERFERKESSDGRHYFNLKAANHQIIGTSQMYKSAASRDDGIASVKNNGASTTVKDLTTA